VNHRTTPDFWDHYRQLPENIQERAERQAERRREREGELAFNRLV
jgi:hypothetical protein